MRRGVFPVLLLTASLTMATAAYATPFYFSTGDTDGLMAMASQPARSNGAVTIPGTEAADDFTLGQDISITSATFTGLITGGAALSDITGVEIEIYHVFPTDSDVGRTSGSPVFGTTQVPTRINSPSDTADAVRDSAASTLSFITQTLSNSFTANNSVSSGINPSPNQTTGGDGPVTGMEVMFEVSFLTPLNLAADHYFFVPQVQLGSGDFLWLSAAKPIVPPGTPFAPDLQAWIRDDNLSPDWLRVGTDIVGGSPAPTFNGTFSLTGDTITSSGNIPEPGTLYLLCGGGVALLASLRLKHRTLPG